jgi:hypothetical protein
MACKLMLLVLAALATTALCVDEVGSSNLKFELAPGLTPWAFGSSAVQGSAKSGAVTNAA